MDGDKSCASRPGVVSEACRDVSFGRLDGAGESVVSLSGGAAPSRPYRERRGNDAAFVVHGQSRRRRLRGTRALPRGTGWLPSRAGLAHGGNRGLREVVPLRARVARLRHGREVGELPLQRLLPRLGELPELCGDALSRHGQGAERALPPGEVRRKGILAAADRQERP